VPLRVSPAWTPPRPRTPPHASFFRTPYANVVVAAVAATQCLHDTVAAHNAAGGGQQKVRLVDAPAVRKVA